MFALPVHSMAYKNASVSLHFSPPSLNCKLILGLWLHCFYDPYSEIKKQQIGYSLLLANRLYLHHFKAIFQCISSHNPVVQGYWLLSVGKRTWRLGMPKAWCLMIRQQTEWSQRKWNRKWVFEPHSVSISYPFAIQQYFLHQILLFFFQPTVHP